MKLKQQPDDFRVEELTDVVPGSAGPFALYRLEKTGWSTPDALQVIRRRWKLEPRRLSHGGLKDRHAHTVQYLTVYRGPQRHLNQQGIRVHYLGQIDSPYSSRSIRANRFVVTVRALSSHERSRAERGLEELERQGVPNYFDDQRFGSATNEGEFVAQHLIRGDYEQALFQALAAPYAHDRASAKREKELLRRLWGDWAACKQQLPRGHARSIADYLVFHPGDYRGAVERLHPELRSLYLSAYQSHLWNGLLARWLVRHCPADRLVSIQLRLGAYPCHRDLDEERFAPLQSLRLVLPAARGSTPDPEQLELIASVLQEEGLELDQLRLKGFRRLFFSKGDRAALSVPVHLRSEFRPDDLHPGKSKLTMQFELQPGAYATMLVKRLLAAPPRDSRDRHVIDRHEHPIDSTEAPEHVPD